MVQFISNGPDIPNELVQAHEEGRVVFFCGAGISFPAGLPSFSGLVNRIYKRVGTSKSDIEKELFKRGQLDTTIDQLERRLPGGRPEVRKALAKSLKPKLHNNDATTTHEALLTLARNRDGKLRLVTTNFDRLFHHASRRIKKPFTDYAAPLLPIPKSSRWDGLVFLHGLLPKKPDNETGLNQLVVSSGDFGLAYLTERWAARFVSELFRNFIVCFVGYSINDPVLRYMMDALAADRMMGESGPDAWALGGYKTGQEEKTLRDWEAKGVRPIPYHATGPDHSVLRMTLKAWAATYRDGIQGKEAVIIQHALSRPQASTQQDDFVGRMLWALSDSSGLPAKRFAEFNPPPSLDWLEAFSRNHFSVDDLAQFNVSTTAKEENALHFSLMRRPSPYTLAEPMSLVSYGVSDCQWDETMRHLAQWLTRHLDNPDLIIWAAKNGDHLHRSWRILIEKSLDRNAQNNTVAQTEGSNSDPSESSNTIRPAIQTLWRLFLSGMVKSSEPCLDLYQWKNRLEYEGMTPSMRRDLLGLLSPKVTIKELPPSEKILRNGGKRPQEIKQILDCSVTLRADHVYDTFEDLGYEHLTSCTELLKDYQNLLQETLILRQEIGNENHDEDLSWFYFPSIEPSDFGQNKHLEDWTILIKLLRDTWLNLVKKDLHRATRIAHDWFDLPYPIFKRLALFTASKDNLIPVQQWVHWLLNDDGRWLWSAETRREVCRLLVLQGRQLDESLQKDLESAILSGPPKEKMQPSPEKAIDRSVWLRLSKLNISGLTLSKQCANRLDSIIHKHPCWKISEDQREEFTYFKSGTLYPEVKSPIKVNHAPRKRKDLVEWLKQEERREHKKPQDSILYKDTWQDVCRTHFLNSLYALYDLSKEGNWLIERWKQALQVWAQKPMPRRSWCYASSLRLDQHMPDDILQEVVHSLAAWMEAVSEVTNTHEDIMLSLCGRILDLPLDPSTGTIIDGKPIDAPVEEAINHPIGYVTESLIHLLSHRKPNDNDRLPKELQVLFTRLRNVDVDRFRHARALMCAQIIFFFRIDRPWTENHLLPLFNWENVKESKTAWQGFLWSPRLYQPLMLAFKTYFLATAEHYSRLGKFQENYASLLTYAGLDQVDGYTTEDFQQAFGKLPKEGLEAAANAMTNALEGAGDQREAFWENRIKPFWHSSWPKSRKLASTDIAAPLARLTIAAGSKLPDALETLQHWLKPFDHLHHVVHALKESRQAKRFPNEILTLLDKVVSTKQPWPPRELKEVLDEIAQADPSLREQRTFKTLCEYVRSRGT